MALTFKSFSASGKRNGTHVMTQKFGAKELFVLFCYTFHHSQDGGKL